MKSKLKLEIHMDNQAFDAGNELFRIIKEMLPMIEDNPSGCGTLKDINGNTVGRWVIENPRSQESYVGEYDMDCPECGTALTGTGVIATGVPIKSTGYQPSKGEVLKNKYIGCLKCGWDQAS